MAIQVQRGAQALLQRTHDANLGLIVNASNEVYDTGNLEPGSAYLTGGTTLSASSGGTIPFLSFAAGGGSSALWMIRPKQSWNSHQIILRVVYRTAPTSATFAMTATATGVVVGQALSGVTVGTANFTLPAPTTSMLQAFEVTLNTSPILSTMETLGILLVRNSDSQSNVLPVTSVAWRVYHT